MMRPFLSANAQSRPLVQRQISDQLLIGKVAELDVGQGLVRVNCANAGEDVLESHWLPWMTGRAGTTRIWLPPALGEQVVILCPDGDLIGGFVIGSLYCDAHPSPATSDIAIISFPDGASISYDPSGHHLIANLPASGTAEITAQGGIKLNGPTTINGALEVNANAQINGTLTASNDVVASGKSLKSHKHLGVQAGTSQSGPPA